MLLTVMEAPEFTLTLAEISASVTHNKAVNLHVTANRRDDFTDPITLSVVGLPPRVTAAPSQYCCRQKRGSPFSESRKF